MACFVVPLVEAIAVSIYRKSNASAIAKAGAPALKKHIPALEKMLWGGSIMLIVDHIINGELTWTFPFFTSLGESGGAAILWREVLTVGVPMALVLTVAWAGWVLVKAKDTRASRA